VERGASRLAARLGVLVVLALAVGTPISPAAPGGDAEELRRREATLAERAGAVLADLTALESRLARAQSELATLRARSQALAAERRDVARRVRIARSSYRAAHAHLVARLRALYVESGPEPLAVLFGARSLREAMATLDGLELAAQEDRELAARIRAAEHRLRKAGRTLARQARALRRTERAAAARAEALAAARSERAAYLTRLRSERALAAARLSQLEERARLQAEAAAQATFDAPAATAPVVAGRTLTVVASGYALQGATASGMEAGWGTVAVDPAVIPLGTHMTIPGYGAGVAADVGSAIQGAAIDLWFPSVGQARGWGRRVVTITLE